MDKNKGIYYGAAGYDAVARRKIKELEKKIGSGGTEMVEKVLFKLEDYEFNVGSGGVCSTQVSDTLNVEIGTACIVEFDGKKYECVATECTISGLPPAALGNMSLFNSNNQFGGNFADTGEPFLIVYAPGEPVVMLVAKSDEAIHTFKISVLEEKASGGSGGGGAGDGFFFVVYDQVADAFTVSGLTFSEVKSRVSSGKPVWGMLQEASGTPESESSRVTTNLFANIELFVDRLNNLEFITLAFHVADGPDVVIPVVLYWLSDNTFTWEQPN